MSATYSLIRMQRKKCENVFERIRTN